MVRGASLWFLFGIWLELSSSIGSNSLEGGGFVALHVALALLYIPVLSN
jgi:hypothetical protein